MPYSSSIQTQGIHRLRAGNPVSAPFQGLAHHPPPYHRSGSMDTLSSLLLPDGVQIEWGRAAGSASCL
jgi:hypothetical protein